MRVKIFGLDRGKRQLWGTDWWKIDKNVDPIMPEVLLTSSKRTGCPPFNNHYAELTLTRKDFDTTHKE